MPHEPTCNVHDVAAGNSNGGFGAVSQLQQSSKNDSGFTFKPAQTSPAGECSVSRQYACSMQACMCNLAWQLTGACSLTKAGCIIMMQQSGWVLTQLQYVAHSNSSVCLLCELNLQQHRLHILAPVLISLRSQGVTVHCACCLLVPLVDSVA